LPSGLRARTAASLSGDRPRKLATALAAADRDAMALCFDSVWEDPTEVLVEPRPSEPSGAIVGGEPSIDVSLAMMRDDALHWLPDDILAKVDRASMAASLEARTPFLDHRVVELAWRLPLQQKTRGGRGKWVLREILRRYLPDDLVNRRKMGFRPPLGIWLRGPLRDWAESLLEPRALARSGLLREQTVRSCWKEHVELGRERTDRLWTILTFQAWLEARSRSASALESRRTDVRPSVLLATSGTSA
jgi:asparagine synthase (glutamine-hydrolysing)